MEINLDILKLKEWVEQIEKIDKSTGEKDE